MPAKRKASNSGSNARSSKIVRADSDSGQSLAALQDGGTAEAVKLFDQWLPLHDCLDDSFCSFLLWWDGVWGQELIANMSYHYVFLSQARVFAPVWFDRELLREQIPKQGSES